MGSPSDSLDRLFKVRTGENQYGLARLMQISMMASRPGGYESSDERSSTISDFSFLGTYCCGPKPAQRTCGGDRHQDFRRTRDGSTNRNSRNRGCALPASRRDLS